MAEITVFPGYTPLPNKDYVATRELRTTFFCLDNAYYDIVDMHGFELEQHLRATEKYFPEEAQDWFKKHSISPAMPSAMTTKPRKASPGWPNFQSSAFGRNKKATY